MIVSSNDSVCFGRKQRSSAQTGADWGITRNRGYMQINIQAQVIASIPSTATISTLRRKETLTLMTLVPATIVRASARTFLSTMDGVFHHVHVHFISLSRRSRDQSVDCIRPRRSPSTVSSSPCPGVFPPPSTGFRHPVVDACPTIGSRST
jgi:hypothetical protein